MHILVSFCNLRAPGVPALGLFDPSTGDLRVLQTPGEVTRHGGITGLAVCPHYVYAVAQPREKMSAGEGSECALLIFDRRDLRLRNRYIFSSGKDVHSLAVSDGVVYAVSTGTDEVLELRLREDQVVSEVPFWRPQPEGARSDLHHLNAIYCWRGELFVSAFGKKSDQPWASARDGFVINISRGETLAAGIDQPHSLAEVGGLLVCCESRKMAVRILDDTRVQHLPGYTRGLCTIGESLFVGTSVGRELSRSTGRVNNPAAGGILGGQCSISRLSASTLEIEQTVDLGVHAQEIYDLLPVEGAEKWPTVGEIAWRDASIRELAALVDQRTRWAKQVLATLNQPEAAITNLQAAVRKGEATEREMMELRAALARQAEALTTITDLQKAILKGEASQREITELRAVVTRQTDTLASLAPTVDFLQVVASWALEQWAPEHVRKQFAYLDQVRRLKVVVAETIPAQTTVLVVSKGDENLLTLLGRKGWHFPQTLDGTYAGSHPANSAAAIIQLEALRVKGADFLLFPATAFWWLDHYTELREHLRCRYREVLSRDEDACVIYDLREPRRPAASAGPGGLADLVLRCRNGLGYEPAILDWNTGLSLASVFPHLAVFSPPGPGPTLPYLDQSIDIVAVPRDSASLPEARRVAKEAVVSVAAAKLGEGPVAVSAVEWRASQPQARGPVVSVILAASADPVRARRQLQSLRHTLPADFRGEIILLVQGSGAEVAEAVSRQEGDGPPPVFCRVPAQAGSGEAWNAAAATATGDYLLFLTGGTVPLDGWLPPLLDTFCSHPRAGVVGSKVLSADGRLEQAGGLVFSDGTTAGFGGGDYLFDDPLYGHVREVDYASDVLFVSPRRVFQALGGLDPGFRSPSYAIADYCFRARREGHRVYYQPDSVVVCLPLDPPRSGVGAMPSRNGASDRDIFAGKWKQALADQPSPRHWRDRDTWLTLTVRSTAGVEGRR